MLFILLTNIIVNVILYIYNKIKCMSLIIYNSKTIIKDIIDIKTVIVKIILLYY